jgi:hypothetical protein
MVQLVTDSGSLSDQRTFDALDALHHQALRRYAGTEQKKV